MIKKNLLLFSLSISLFGCGHSQSYKVGLMSFGDLEGKSISDHSGATTREGADCGHSQYLSNAVRDALKDTEYDTLVDAEVTSETGLLVFSNCIKVKGQAINSATLSN